MPRNKLKKFAEIETYPNVIHKPDSLAGNWKSTFFQNRNPITLELGCGAGLLTLELARRHSDRNYIGIDNKRARVWQGATQALSEKLGNAAFISTRIELLDAYFGAGEVDEIWIAFPDPFPKPSKSNKRLMSPELLSIYSKFTSPGCIFHVKTDDDVLFDFTLATIESVNARIHQISKNTHHDAGIPEDVKIRTIYEERHLAEGKTIKYVRFTIN